MMRIPQRFHTEFSTAAGFIFRGTLSVAPESHAAPADFAAPRLWLRVHPECGVAARDEVTDEQGRRFLLAEHELAGTVYRAFKAFPLTHQVSWQRMSTVVDALTQLPKSTTPAELGPIWVLRDPKARVFVDLQTHISPNTQTIVTGQAIALNDTIDGKVIKRLNPVLGVFLAECE